MTLVGTTWKFKVFLPSSLKPASPLTTGMSFPSAICAKKTHGNFQLNTWAFSGSWQEPTLRSDYPCTEWVQVSPTAAASFHPDCECTKRFQLSSSGRHWKRPLDQAWTPMIQVSIAVWSFQNKASHIMRTCFSLSESPKYLHLQIKIAWIILPALCCTKAAWKNSPLLLSLRFFQFPGPVKSTSKLFTATPQTLRRVKNQSGLSLTSRKNSQGCNFHNNK